MRKFKFIAALVAALISASCMGAGSKMAWMEQLDALCKNRQEINVYMKYNEPIGPYEVTMLLQPFTTSSETGLLIANFRDTLTNRSFQYVNDEKFTSHHIYEIVYGKEFKGHHDGDVHYLSTATPEQKFYLDSPLNYYASFQLYDVDFDGEDELLVSDWYQGQTGNMYSAYDITLNGLEEKSETPFDQIDNCTMFYPETGKIELKSHEGYAYSCVEVYKVEGGHATLESKQEFRK